MHFFKQNGYLIIKNLFSHDVLESFKQRFNEICNNKSLSKYCSVLIDKKLRSEDSKPENYVNKIQDILNDPVFMRYSESPELLTVVSQCIGGDITALNCMLVNKPPGVSRHPSHQDAFYFPIRPMDVIGTWTAIDKSTIDNGCLYCVPGSHKLGLLPHKAFDDSKKFYHCIENETHYAPEEHRVQLEMEPGDTVILHPHLIHGSGENITKTCRKAMTVHYMSSRCRFVSIEGTVQESILKDFEETVQKNGVPESYQVMWQLKSKVVSRRQSHL